MKNKTKKLKDIEKEYLKLRLMFPLITDEQLAQILEVPLSKIIELKNNSYMKNSIIEANLKFEEQSIKLLKIANVCIEKIFKKRVKKQCRKY